MTRNLDTTTERSLRYLILISELLVNWGVMELFYRSGLFQAPIGMSVMRVCTVCTLVYIICNLQVGIVAHTALVRPDQILRRVFSGVLYYIVFCMALMSFLKVGVKPLWAVLAYTLTLCVVVIAHRMIWRRGLQRWRKRDSVLQRVVFVGNLQNARQLFMKMKIDRSTGYEILGYFAEGPQPLIAGDIPWLGPPADAGQWIIDHPHRINQLYSTLSSDDALNEAIVQVCENHLVHYLVVPGYRNYIHHGMHFNFMYGVPVLSMRREPLTRPHNRFIKRSFDLLVSSLFLLTLFPIVYALFGVLIKLSSPGPVLFKQKRSGQNGREFRCYKFRSMKVNKDCDSLQATKDDPRKTRIGDFLRHTNIDELPQFINVLRGEMSIVGPRPHMLKHTQQYATIIDKYMVRHFVKPGITGWAQVTGFRGETRELWQMEGRVEADIWYIEHWTFVLDLFILYKTIVNAFKGDKKAY